METKAQDRGAKFLALLLAVGGVLGVAITVYMAYTFLQQHWVYIVLVAAFAALFVWTALTGVRLWRNEARGWKWAKILFAAQIPVLTVPGLSYEYYAGIAIKIIGGEVDSYFNVGLGANANFYLGTSITGLVYGVNIFALLALLYLFVKSRPGAALTSDAPPRAG